MAETFWKEALLMQVQASVNRIVCTVFKDGYVQNTLMLQEVCNKLEQATTVNVVPFCMDAAGSVSASVVLASKT